jgi:CheY-like chemotaxis protein
MIDTAQRVLIVDDEVSVRRYLRAAVGAEGFTTHEAKTGQ